MGWRKIIVIVIVSLLIVDYLLSKTELLAQNEIVNKADKDNAAIYYNKAFELLKFFDLESKSFDTIDTVIEINKDLQEIIAKNEESLIEFKKGVLLEECDFNFGKKYEYLTDKPALPFYKIRQLMNLVLLKGRQYEKVKNFDEAINEYFSILTFAKHISYDKSIVSKMVAVALEYSACESIERYLNFEKANKELCLRIAQYLSTYKENHFSTSDIYMNEKEYFLSMLQKGIDASKAMVINKVMKKLIKSEDIYQNEILRQGQELANKYYGILIRVAEVNTDSEWEIYRVAMEDLMQELKIRSADEIIMQMAKFADTNGVSMLLNVDKFASLLNIKLGDSTELIASKVVKAILLVAMDNIPRCAAHYYRILNKLEDIKLLAERKANKF